MNLNVDVLVSLKRKGDHALVKRLLKRHHLWLKRVRVKENKKLLLEQKQSVRQKRLWLGLCAVQACPNQHNSTTLCDWHQKIKNGYNKRRKKRGR